MTRRSPPNFLQIHLIPKLGGHVIPACGIRKMIGVLFERDIPGHDGRGKWVVEIGIGRQIRQLGAKASAKAAQKGGGRDATSQEPSIDCVYNEREIRAFRPRNQPPDATCDLDTSRCRVDKCNYPSGLRWKTSPRWRTLVSNQAMLFQLECFVSKMGIHFSEAFSLNVDGAPSSPNPQAAASPVHSGPGGPHMECGINNHNNARNL